MDDYIVRTSSFKRLHNFKAENDERAKALFIDWFYLFNTTNHYYTYLYLYNVRTNNEYAYDILGQRWSETN